MSLYDKIYNYCERGQDGAFWAEPLNAVSNGAFIVAALFATVAWLALPRDRRGFAEAVLIVLTYVIGVGSFLFHTYANRWSAYADTIPIGLFMLATFAFVLRRFFGLNWILVLVGLAAFFAALRYAGTIECRPALLPVTAAAGARCLNGTVGYTPAFFALAGSATGLAMMRHPAWRSLLVAALVFLVAMTFRTLDLEVCDLTRIGGHARGTHFLWHILNAVTLYILLRAAIWHGGPRLRPAD
jgi:hypothetical protein